MIEYHANLGGFWYWILIKSCKTSLREEQAIKNKRRNLIFLGILNIIFALIGASFLIYTIYF